MGADITASPGAKGARTLPLMIRGLAPAIPLSYRLPMASAQVKSAVLLAGLNTPGVTEVIEPVPTRDHSERMLQSFGADLRVGTGAAATRQIRVRGEAEIRQPTTPLPCGTPSASFFLVAALLVPGPTVTPPNVGLNPNSTRTGAVRPG